MQISREQDRLRSNPVLRFSLTHAIKRTCCVLPSTEVPYTTDCTAARRGFAITFGEEPLHECSHFPQASQSQIAATRTSTKRCYLVPHIKRLVFQHHQPANTFVILLHTTTMKRDYRRALPTTTVVVIEPTPQPDDEHSVSSASSTVGVINFTTPKKSKKTKVPRRRVHFDESHNQYHKAASSSSSSSSSSLALSPSSSSSPTWYSESELQQFKAQTFAMAREIYRHDLLVTDEDPTSYTNVVAGVYDACRRSKQDDDDDDTAINLLTQQQQMLLRKWLRVGTSRLGLERLCIRAMADDRKVRRTLLVDAVMELHEHYYADEVIGNTAAAWSRPSRLFAQQLAAALAASL